MSKMISKDEYMMILRTWWRRPGDDENMVDDEQYDEILQCCQIRLHINEWYEEDQFDEENGGEYDAHDGSAKIVIQPACFGAGSYIEMATSYH